MKKILIIDDELDLVEKLKKRLEMSGYEVHGACSGFEGLDKAKKERPHLILLDIMMPDLDGFEVLSRLKESTETALTHVIMITAKSDTPSILMAEKSYATDYIIKPFQISDLLNMIQKYI